MSNIPKRNLASGCHLLKKTDQPSCRTTRRNYKHTSNRVHIIQIASTAPSFLGICAIRNPLKIHCYTCMLFETLKSADLHESILTPVSCHKHVRHHDGVTLYFSLKFHR